MHICIIYIYIYIHIISYYIILHDVVLYYIILSIACSKSQRQAFEHVAGTPLFFLFPLHCITGYTS